ncbi:MAG: ribonuclease P protein component [Planctomycetales bacterium]|nr:ribonuclease P protein component [Planctomycetales bacterium]
MDERFRKHQHLRRQVEFARVYERRNSVADSLLIVYGLPNDFPFARLGLSVSRKVGNAVTRNWWKRRIREVFRRSQNSIPQGMDYIVIPRAGADAKPRFQELAESLTTLCSRVERKYQRGHNR